MSPFVPWSNPEDHVAFKLAIFLNFAIHVLKEKKKDKKKGKKQKREKKIK